MSQNPNLFLSIGKPIKDEYGHVIGKVASFSITPNGKFDGAFVEFSSGKFSKQPLVLKSHSSRQPNRKLSLYAIRCHLYGAKIKP